MSFSSHHQASLKSWNAQVSRQIKDEAWDAFLQKASAGHHVQSSAWAETKALLGWKVVRLTVSKGQSIIAGVQMLVSDKRWVGKLAFASKGPVFLQEDEALEHFLLKELQKCIRNNGIRYFALQTPQTSKRFDNILRKMAFKESETSLAPTATVIIDLRAREEELLSKMRKKTRQYIKKGYREGIQVREGRFEDISRFYGLLELSAQRIGFQPYSQSYYQTMWQAFKKREKVQKQITLLLAELEGELITALLVIGFNQTAVTKTIGWSGLHASCRPNEAVYWAAVQWAKAQGYHFIDLEGIKEEAADSLLKGKPLSDAMRHTPSFFKIGFGGEIKKLPPAYEYIPNSLFKWGYTTILPKIKNSSFMTGLLERIRTQEQR